MEIKLQSDEILAAALCGVMRQVQNLKLGRVPAYGVGAHEHWQVHVEGALGECALAKYLDVYWIGTGKLRAEDVGEVDVRTTSHDNGRLILHEDDPDDRRFYLLTGSNGNYQVRGSILARDGKLARFWQDPSGKGRPAFFVPQSELKL